MIDAPTSSEMSIVSTQDRWSPLRNPSTHEQQLMGIASAFLLRSPSFGGRGRSSSYGGPVAPPILRGAVARMEPSAFRDRDAANKAPDFASLHPATNLRSLGYLG